MATVAQPAIRLATGDTVGAAVGGFEALLALFAPREGEDVAPQPENGRRPAGATGRDAGQDEAALASWLAQAMGGVQALDPAVAAAPAADGQPAGAGDEAGDGAVTCDLSDLKAGLPAGPRLDQHQAATEALLAAADGQPAASRPAVPVAETTASAPQRAPTAPAIEADIAITTEVLAQAVEAASGEQTAAAQEPAAQTTAPPAASLALQAQSAALAADPRLADARSNARREAATQATGGREAVSGDGAPAKAATPAGEPAPVEAAAADADVGADAPPPVITAAEPAAPDGEGEAVGAFTTSSATAQAADGAAGSAQAVRGAPETVARLAAGILEKLGLQTSRFEMRLDPHGLGTVDVSLEIKADGQLSASMTFDTAQAAQELRARAGELRQALEQAGFTLADDSLTFDLAGQDGRSGSQPGQDQERQPMVSAAFTRLFDSLEAEAAPIRLSARRGLDIVI